MGIGNKGRKSFFNKSSFRHWRELFFDRRPTVDKVMKIIDEPYEFVGTSGFYVEVGGGERVERLSSRFDEAANTSYRVIVVDDSLDDDAWREDYLHDASPEQIFLGDLASRLMDGEKIVVDDGRGNSQQLTWENLPRFFKEFGPGEIGYLARCLTMDPADIVREFRLLPFGHGLTNLSNGDTDDGEE